MIKCTLTILIPELSIDMQVDLNPSLTVDTIIGQVITRCKFSGDCDFEAYGLGTSFSHIPRSEKCCNLLSAGYHYIVLRSTESSIQETIFVYEGRMTSIATFKGDTLQIPFRIALRCLNLPLNEDFYIVYSPSSDEIISFCSKFIPNFIIIKRFLPSNFPGFFSVQKVLNNPIPQQCQVIPFQQIVSSIISPELQSLMASLSKHPDSLNIIELTSQKIQVLLCSLSTNHNCSNMTMEEQTSLLFTILSSSPEPIISDSIRALISKLSSFSECNIKFDAIRAIISLLPLHSFFILTHLLNSIGGITSPESRLKQISLLFDSLFDHSSEENQIISPNEIDFLKHILLFNHALLCLPGQRVVIGNGQLLLMKNNALYNVNCEEVQLSSDEIIPLSTPVPIEQAIRSLIDACKEESMIFSSLEILKDLNKEYQIKEELDEKKDRLLKEINMQLKSFDVQISVLDDD